MVLPLLPSVTVASLMMMPGKLAACVTEAAHAASPNTTKSIASLFFMNFKFVSAVVLRMAAKELSGFDCIASEG